MKITPLKCETLEITDVTGLDPVRVIVQDIGPGQGRITIECWGRAWSQFWGAMGPNTMRQFFAEAEPEYLENALHCGQSPRKQDREYLKRIVTAVQKSFQQPKEDLNRRVDRQIGARMMAARSNRINP